MKSDSQDSSNGYRGWEYARQGDYHRNLDLNWRYAPTYLKKMKWVRNFIDRLPMRAKILDAGCGEGVLVEEYAKLGRSIEGLDLHYSSKYVRRGDICQMPYSESSFDVVLLLDVFEHLAYADQSVALQEIHRVLSKNGYLVTSIPNLAHLSSRVSFSLLGKLHRTDAVTNHIGERPYQENRKILLENRFHIDRCHGVTLTIPILYRVIAHYPRHLRWLHDLIDPLAIPSIAMLNIFFCSTID